MSIFAMSYVWDNSPAKGAELLVQLAIADAANPDGVAWPSIPKLAKMARCTEPTVRRAIEHWGQSGELQVFVGGFLDGKNQSNTYRIVMGRQDLTTPPERPDVKGVGNSRYPQAGIENPRPCKEPKVGTPSAAGAADPETGQLFAPPDAEVPADSKAVDAAILEGKIQIVWEHYCGHFGDKLRIKGLTDSRRKCVKSALKVVSDEEHVLLKAIDGFVRYRQTKPGSTSIEDIFSSRPGGSSLTELIEFWIGQADDSPTMASSVPPILRERVSRRRLTVVESLQRPDDEHKRAEAREAVEWLAAKAKEKPVIEDGRVVRWERMP